MQYISKKEAITLLSLCALLTEDSEAVRQCAIRLAERADGALQKCLLGPLADCDFALDIVMEEYVYPKEEMRLGFIWRDKFEYEIVASFHEVLDYDVKDVVATVAATFVDWGVTEGRLKMRILHPTNGDFKYHYANLDEYASQRYGVSQAA